MIARRYQPSDFPVVKEWGEQYGSEYREHQFPKTGFIVDGYAACFLYSSDSSCCWFENLISNRDADPGKRGRALALIIEALFNEAKRLGFKVAYATTNNTAVLSRGVYCGAKIEPGQFLLTKDLGEQNETIGR